MPRQREWATSPTILDALPSMASRFGDSYEEVVDAIEALPPRQREAIELRFWGRMTQKQIALQWGVTQQTVSYHERRARKRLQEVLRGQVGRGR